MTTKPQLFRHTSIVIQNKPANRTNERVHQPCQTNARYLTCLSRVGIVGGQPLASHGPIRPLAGGGGGQVHPHINSKRPIPGEAARTQDEPPRPQVRRSNTLDYYA